MTIFLLAPSPNMAFASLPSGSTYLSDDNGLILISNGSVADQIALVDAGCVTLNPLPGGGVNFQSGTVYTVQAADNGNLLLFTNSAAIAVTLPANLPAGFRCRLYQAGTGPLTLQAGSGANLVSPINVVNSTAQYYAFDCAVIYQNAGNTSAGWDALIVPTPGVGTGIVGATTLANLYAADTANHYPQYTTGNVYADGTPANDGTWLKTGNGNGSGNWAQISTLTLTGVDAQVLANTSAIAALAAPIAALQGTLSIALWPDTKSYDWGVFDSTGNPLLGLLPGGGSIGLVNDPEIPLRTVYVWPDVAASLLSDVAFLDANGIELNYAAAPGGYAAFVGYLDSTSHVCALSPTQVPDVPIASARASWCSTPAPAIRGLGQPDKSNLLKWMDDGTADNLASNGCGTPAHEARLFNFNGASAIAALGGINKLVFIPMTGQSLSIGITATALTTANVFSRAFMFNGGPMPYTPWTAVGFGGAMAWPGPLCLDTQLQTLVPLVERSISSPTQAGETYGGGISYWLGQGTNLEATSAMVFATLGAGGCTLAMLNQLQTTYSPGAGYGGPFASQIRCAEIVAAWCKLNGWTLEIPCVVMDQGENDYTTSGATYLAELLAMQSQLNTALGNILTRLGQTAPSQIKLLMMQPSSWSFYNDTTAPNVYEQLAAAIGWPTQFAVIGPQYYIDNYNSASGQHQTDIGYRLDGEWTGRAIQKLRGSLATEALYATAASSSGTTLTITFSNATQLVHDTSVVSDPNGQWGLRVLDTSNGNANVALSGFGIVGTNQIQCTMASETAGHVYMLGIADYAYGTLGQVCGPTTSPRAPIRDSAVDVSSAATGNVPMVNFACHQQLTFTGA